jgi:hypothetical protein
MSSEVISNDLRAAAQRKGVTQVRLAKGTMRAKQTVNGYFKDEPTPLDAVRDIAGFINDSTFTQKMSFKFFNLLPPMESDIYQESPHALDMIEAYESEERSIRKKRAMMALAKNRNALSDEDREAIVDYAVNYLDEVFVEMKCIESIFGTLDMSVMDGIKMRTPYWKAQKYMRGE